MAEEKDLTIAPTHDDRIQAGLADNVPKLYFNGFATGLGQGDIIFVLEQNNRPVVTLNASYTMVKTLAHKLGGLIARIEEDSGNTIMTTDDVNRYLAKGAAKEKAIRKKVAKKKTTRKKIAKKKAAKKKNSKRKTS